MPIKELMTLTTMLLTGWFWSSGQVGVMRNIQKFKLAVLKDVGRTDNWGNPSIFQYSRHPKKVRVDHHAH